MTEPSSSKTLQMAGISKQFGGQLALDDVHLNVEPGNVHGLIGQNGAGKSTVVNILAGRLRPNDGEVRLGNRVIVSPGGTERHLEALIAVVHQEGSVLPDLTIGENLVLGDGRVALARVSRGELRKRVRTAYAIGLPVPNPFVLCAPFRRPTGNPRDRPRFSSEAHFILLDEPTASLDPRMTEWLIGAMRHAAREGGRGIIFVSHRLREIQRGTDSVTILRDGKVVWDGDRELISAAEMVQHIAGKEIAKRVEAAAEHHKAHSVVEVNSPPALQLTTFTCGLVQNINLSVRKGEIVGVAGVEGQGQRDLFYALAGTRRYHGSVAVEGRTVRLRGRHVAMRAGIMFLPDDRARQGVIAPMNVGDNMKTASIGSLSWALGIRSRPEERKFVARSSERFSI